MGQVFISWSGGKDSCLACYRAMQDGFDVGYLLNMTDEDGHWSWVHRLSPELLEMQSQSIGIPLVQKQPKMATYESDFLNAIIDLRGSGIEGGVYGDIDIDEHRAWVEGVSVRAGITPYLPLWGLPQDRILNDFINLGFEAVIIVVNTELLGIEWLGRKVDQDCLAALRQRKGITPCGEAGEYHTFATGGPIFQQRIDIIQAKHRLKGGYGFLEINRAELIEK